MIHKVKIEKNVIIYQRILRAEYMSQSIFELPLNIEH